MDTNTNITCDDPEINVAHNNKYKDKKTTESHKYYKTRTNTRLHEHTQKIYLRISACGDDLQTNIATTITNTKTKTRTHAQTQI